MEENKTTNNEIQVELSDEMAQGTYANLAIISHSASEFILDFIRVVPGAPKAQVKSRIILTPDNAYRLRYALFLCIKFLFANCLLILLDFCYFIFYL